MGKILLCIFLGVSQFSDHEDLIKNVYSKKKKGQWRKKKKTKRLLQILCQLHAGIEMNIEHYPSWYSTASAQPRGVLLWVGSHGLPCSTKWQVQTITGHTVLAVTFQDLAKPNKVFHLQTCEENHCIDRERKQLMWVYLWIFKPHIVRWEDSGLVAHCSCPPVTIFLGNQNHIPLLKG